MPAKQTENRECRARTALTSTMMSEHQKHTEFLRHCLRYGESTEHQALEEKITQIQRDERCVQRAVWLMAILTALAVAVLGYPAILVENFPYNTPQFIVNLICALGLASPICLLVFIGLGMVYRGKLDQRREESRQLVTKSVGSPAWASRLPRPCETGKTIVPAREMTKPSGLPTGQWFSSKSSKDSIAVVGLCPDSVGKVPGVILSRIKVQVGSVFAEPIPIMHGRVTPHSEKPTGNVASPN